MFLQTISQSSPVTLETIQEKNPRRMNKQERERKGEEKHKIYEKRQPWENTREHREGESISTYERNKKAGKAKKDEINCGNILVNKRESARQWKA